MWLNILKIVQVSDDRSTFGSNVRNMCKLSNTDNPGMLRKTVLVVIKINKHHA